jgi:predicted DNA-binding protein
MEVNLGSELEARLNELAATTGRAKEELVREVVSTYLDEVAETRRMLDSRYADIKSGRVKPVDGEEVFARLRQKSENRRHNPA